MRAGRALWAVGMVMVAAVACGQETARREPMTSVVSGRATCADTNMPARFAMVTLEPVPVEKGAKKAETEQVEGMNATGTTDIEGRYLIEKVKPGKYYVLGSLPGYLNPLARFSEDELTKMSEETRKKLAASVPVIEVAAGQPVGVDLRLERAAEIDGTVAYDDGSPAVGVKLALLKKNKAGELEAVNSGLGSWIGMFGAGNATDDRGRFRLVGMPPGEYVVSASLPSQEISVGGLLGGRGMSVTVRNHEAGALTVYLGNVYRKREAKLVKVGEAETVGGVDITIALAGLSSVRGVVVAARDGHTINKGRVVLVYPDDQEQVRSVEVQADGSFQMTYLPQEKYLLRVLGAADAEEVTRSEGNYSYSEEKVVHSYGEAEQAVTVAGDLTGLELAVPEVKK